MIVAHDAVEDLLGDRDAVDIADPGRVKRRWVKIQRAVIDSSSPGFLSGSFLRERRNRVESGEESEC